jgi:hypothetical protein
VDLHGPARWRAARFQLLTTTLPHGHQVERVA